MQDDKSLAKKVDQIEIKLTIKKTDFCSNENWNYFVEDFKDFAMELPNLEKEEEELFFEKYIDLQEFAFDFMVENELKGDVSINFSSTKDSLKNKDRTELAPDNQKHTRFIKK